MPVTTAYSRWTINVFPSNHLVKTSCISPSCISRCLMKRRLRSIRGFLNCYSVHCTLLKVSMTFFLFWKSLETRISSKKCHNECQHYNNKRVFFFFLLSHIQVRKNLKQTQIQPTNLERPNFNVTLDSTSLQQYSWSPLYGHLVNTDKFSWPLVTVETGFTVLVSNQHLHFSINGFNLR